MAVVKSDAMLMHEKWIEEVVSHRPKRTKVTKMLPEPKDLILAGAVIVIIVVGLATLMS